MKADPALLPRRHFLRTATVAGLAAPFTGVTWTRAASPNGKLSHACIGVGGMGWGDLQNFLQHKKVQIVALCDVDARNLQNAAKVVPDARTYADWRELFDKEKDRIDSVNVTVPDHMHFPIAYRAIKLGRHVYCQKPMCHDVAEVRALTEAADIYHPTKWRAWQDFGTGWSGDIGCHIFDAVWKGLGLKPATSVAAEVQTSWKDAADRRRDNWPQSDHITWTFPGNDLIEGKALTLEWFDGEMFPPKEVRALFKEDDYPPESAMVLGSEGALLNAHGGSRPFLLPEEKFKNLPLPKLDNRNHYHHFVDACLGGEKTESHFAQTGPMTEAILLGTVAIRAPDQRLEWDSARLKLRNSAAAERYLRRDYRAGWDVAGV